MSIEKQVIKKHLQELPHVIPTTRQFSIDIAPALQAALARLASVPMPVINEPAKQLVEADSDTM